MYEVRLNGRRCYLKIKNKRWGVTSADDMEPNFFYARDYEGEEGVMLGEIRNIQVEPEWDGDVSKLNAGDTFVYSTPNLLD